MIAATLPTPTTAFLASKRGTLRDHVKNGRVLDVVLAIGIGATNDLTLLWQVMMIGIIFDDFRIVEWIKPVLLHNFRVSRIGPHPWL